MGGEQAAGVLATVKRDGIEARGGDWSAEEEEAFKAPIREQYEHQGSPWYATARLWDDGIIDPAVTRRVLGLGISASLNAPVEPARLGGFRTCTAGRRRLDRNSGVSGKSGAVRVALGRSRVINKKNT